MRRELSIIGSIPNLVSNTKWTLVAFYHQESGGKNHYSNWKFGMRIFLEPEDLWNLVTGNEINVKGAKVKSKDMSYDG